MKEITLILAIVFFLLCGVLMAIKFYRVVVLGLEPLGMITLFIVVTFILGWLSFFISVHNEK